MAMRRDRQYFVYIMTNRYHTVFYTGATNDLYRRILEHKKKRIRGFTARYNIVKLVYYEATDDVYAAIAREKQLKNWHRKWKMNLIRANNPMFADLSRELFDYGEYDGSGDPETSSG